MSEDAVRRRRTEQAVDPPALDSGERWQTIEWFSQHVEHSSNGRRPHRDVNALTGPLDKHSASQPLCVAQSDGADDSPGQQLLDLQDQGSASVHNREGLVEARQL